MMLPWGRYRDVQLEEVPTSYLQRFLDKATNLSPALLRAVKQEVDSRRVRVSKAEAGRAVT